MTNKELVLKVYEEIFNGWDTSKVDIYFREDYKQHSAGVENGREGFKKFLSVFLPMEPHMEIVKTAEDGDMVFIFFKCTMGNGSVNKVCDIYRVEGGQLAEHWDVVEHGVENVVPVSGNGLF